MYFNVSRAVNSGSSVTVVLDDVDPVWLGVCSFKDAPPPASHGNTPGRRNGAFYTFKNGALTTDTVWRLVALGSVLVCCSCFLDTSRWITLQPATLSRPSFPGAGRSPYCTGLQPRGKSSGHRMFCWPGGLTLTAFQRFCESRKLYINWEGDYGSCGSM